VLTVLFHIDLMRANFAVALRLAVTSEYEGQGLLECKALAHRIASQRILDQLDRRVRIGHFDD